MAQISHLYDTFEQADAAVTELKAAGLDASDIAFIANNSDDWYAKNDDVKIVDAKHDKDRDGMDDRKEGAAVGAGIGGTAIGALGLLAGLGVIAIPGIGPVVAAGWLTTAITGAVAGGVTGGIVGALVESGVEKNDADMYAEAIRRGGALVVAKVPENEKLRYQRVLMERGIDLGKRRSAYSEAGWARFDEKAPPYSADQVRQERMLYR
jgi:hypothetical protein